MITEPVNIGFFLLRVVQFMTNFFTLGRLVEAKNDLSTGKHSPVARGCIALSSIVMIFIVISFIIDSLHGGTHFILLYTRLNRPRLLFAVRVTVEFLFCTASAPVAAFSVLEFGFASRTNNCRTNIAANIRDSTSTFDAEGICSADEMVAVSASIVR